MLTASYTWLLIDHVINVYSYTTKQNTIASEHPENNSDTLLVEIMRILNENMKLIGANVY